MSRQWRPDLSLERDGFTRHGPVSLALGATEFRRIWEILTTIQRLGYDRSAGQELKEAGVTVEILRRGNELHYLNRGGLHRMAAMDALGECDIPARLYSQTIIDRSEAGSWQQVRSGVWTRAEAERYFDHLFDFDAREWWMRPVRRKLAPTPGATAVGALPQAKRSTSTRAKPARPRATRSGVAKNF